MVTILELDVIRDWPRNEAAAEREYEQRKRRGLPAKRPRPRHPWVALVTGLDDRYGIGREFVRPLTDYRDARGTGRRGVKMYFTLREGEVYEIRRLIDEDRERRYFARVVDGEVVEMGEREVRRWLESAQTGNGG